VPDFGRVFLMLKYTDITQNDIFVLRDIILYLHFKLEKCLHFVCVCILVIRTSY
jgi:hypothetical protein